MFKKYDTKNTKKITKDEMKNSFILGDRVDALKTIPDESIDIIFTSPPYNVKKTYDINEDGLTYDEYLDWLYETWEECKRVLVDGGRFILNIPMTITYQKGYKHITADSVKQFEKLGFTLMGEAIWDKGNVTSRTAWGSFKSPSAPYLVQPYEMVLIFGKNGRKLKGDKEFADITKEEFINYSYSMWKVRPETAKHKDHPAPFPRELVYRVLKFFSFEGNTVLDPFSGTGTTAQVANLTNRNFVYIDNSEKYLNWAKEQIENNVDNKELINFEPKGKINILGVKISEKEFNKLVEQSNKLIKLNNKRASFLTIDEDKKEEYKELLNITEKYNDILLKKKITLTESALLDDICNETSNKAAELYLKYYKMTK